MLSEETMRIIGGEAQQVDKVFFLLILTLRLHAVN